MTWTTSWLGTPSNPAEGGAENFLKCHLAVVSLLDAAGELGILKKVTDESDYWKHRDRQRLVQTVRQWNRMIAGFAGKLKDSGYGVEAPITDFPNYEHLEAEDEKTRAARNEEV